MKRTIFFIIIAIIVIVLLYFGIRYYNCLKDEGSPCGSFYRQAGGSEPIQLKGKYRCGFFSGKQCII